jgi:hypothetical protein
VNAWAVGARRRSVAVLAVGFMALAASGPGAVPAKPKLAKIEISGGGLTRPVQITDAAIVRRFSIWTGPGTSEGWRAQPGAIIDWPRRQAAEPPAGLPRYEVRFYWEASGEPIYRVVYAFDRREEGGFMYLPASHTSTIVHGVEGRWFHSSSEWERLVRPYLKQQKPEGP